MYYIGVIGAARCNNRMLELAEEVGREIATKGAVLLCGGRGGVMESAARGARRSGGVSIGLLPGMSRAEGNHELTYAIPTGLGNARNAVLACAGDAFIAISGGYGTLSEIGLALKISKPVVGLGTWEAKPPPGSDYEVIMARDAAEAVKTALQLAAVGSARRLTT